MRNRGSYILKEPKATYLPTALHRLYFKKHKHKNKKTFNL